MCAQRLFPEKESLSQEGIQTKILRILLHTCQFSCIMCESHACKLKTAISRIKDNFLRLTHKSGRVVLKKLHFISDLLCIISLPFITIPKSFQMSTIHSNRKCSKVIEISLDILGNLRKSLENRQKSSEVAGTFSEIPLMLRQKSHAFDSEKVGKYTTYDPGFGQNSATFSTLSVNWIAWVGLGVGGTKPSQIAHD